MSATTGRTFAIGDIHGDLGALRTLIAKLPPLTAADTIVLLGDYVDRGPDSAGVVAYVRAMPAAQPCKVVALRGNHEDAWLQVVEKGWPEFVVPRGNGCFETMRSFMGGDVSTIDDGIGDDEFQALLKGSFFPPEVVVWMKELPFWYEDEHAIYVHAGLTPDESGAYAHPRYALKPSALLWTRTEAFFRNYRGKRVVVGHTHTMELPQELSTYTVDDPTDLWAGPAVVAIDTGCGREGFLTAVELPSMTVYESR